MTADQLQTVFQVTSPHDVPIYELITLSHHGSDHHVVRRDTSANHLLPTTADDDFPSEPHHQHFSHKKADLSKSSYYSPAKHDRTSGQQQQKKKQQYLDVRLLAEHNVSLSAFGESYNLTLRPTQGLFRDGPHGLRMWTVTSEPNATHGLEYRPVLEVSEHEDVLYKYKYML